MCSTDDDTCATTQKMKKKTQQKTKRCANRSTRPPPASEHAPIWPRPPPPRSLSFLRKNKTVGPANGHTPLPIHPPHDTALSLAVPSPAHPTPLHGETIWPPSPKMAVVLNLSWYTRTVQSMPISLFRIRFPPTPPPPISQPRGETWSPSAAGWV